MACERAFFLANGAFPASLTLVFMSRIAVRCFFAVLAAASLLLGACSRGSRVEQAARDGIFLIGNASEPSSLDPHIATGVSEHVILMSVMEGLATEHPSEEDVVPGVAERWESNETFDEWTFHLRKDARWSNGDPVTARDFLYAFRRILSPKLASQYAEMLYVMKGAEAFNRGDLTDPAELGASAPDDHTLKISLVGPTPYFPLMLPHYAWYPVHPPTIEAHGGIDSRGNRWTHENFVGNGPFKIKTWQFKRLVAVERNPHYWDSKTVQLNEIHFYPIDNLATEERMFRDGQLHVTYELPLDKVGYWRKDPSGSYRSEPYLGVYFYRINTTHPQLKDQRVRRALSLAVNRAAVAENVLHGNAIPAQAYTPPVAGYVGPDLIKYDPEAARQLLAEAGYGLGNPLPRFDILLNVSEKHKILAEAIQQMWKKELGIEVGINSQDWGVYLDSQQRLDYDVCRAGWIADYSDPMSFLDMWTTGNGNNQTGWSNAEYDAFIAKARVTGETSARFEVLRQAEALMLESQPVIPIYVYLRPRLVSSLVEGWYPKMQDFRPWKNISLRLPFEG
jgi:oligopeptide transport system substrate-binding protein